VTTISVDVVTNATFDAGGKALPELAPALKPPAGPAAPAPPGAPAPLARLFRAPPPPEGPGLERMGIVPVLVPVLVCDRAL
jgi:hypothetical protein